MKLRRKQQRVDGCVDSICRGDKRHGPCRVCNAKTDTRSIYIEKGTLQRKLGFLCWGCELAGTARRSDEALRAKRTSKDWEEMTDIPDGELREEMGDQYPGYGRQIVRLFHGSDASVATVDNISVGTLNSVIRTLGLSRDIYAEQRGQETVLRRVVDNA